MIFKQNESSERMDRFLDDEEWSTTFPYWRVNPFPAIDLIIVLSYLRQKRDVMWVIWTNLLNLRHYGFKGEVS